MSLFDLQDVCIAIGSIATLDLPMVVDLIGIYGLKGPYCTLTTTNWFFQELSVIPRGSWGDVVRRSYHDPLGKSGIVIPEPQWLGFWGVRLPKSQQRSNRDLPMLRGKTVILHWVLKNGFSDHDAAAAAAVVASPEFVPAKFDEENPSAQISSGLLVQADEGIPFPVVDLIDDIYRRLP
ncbi:helicase domain-containing family protein [Dorcoceras hygrometricum]|uniref:Helicase domain-containing family protein n=1 Tax=Dorcoceras hygrometricum TaxID=472368 RepID=A0A2Z7C7W1_9LAMI|nr:helicase domain-containing family protein [Dorcoceras hygrometricum]